MKTPSTPIKRHEPLEINDDPLPVEVANNLAISVDLAHDAAVEHYGANYHADMPHGVKITPQDTQADMGTYFAHRRQRDK